VTAVAGAPKWAGFSDEQSRALNALVARVDRAVEELKAPDRVLDRRGSSTAVRPRPGDVVRVQAGGVVVLPHPRSAKGRAPIVVLVEGQPVDVLAEAGTVNDEERLTVTTVGAMEWWSTGTEWWGTAVGGSSGGGGTSLTYGSPVAVGLANADGVSTAVARADHVHEDYAATGTEDGFLSRRVYVNAASARIGTTFMGVTVEAVPASFTAIGDFGDGGRFRIGLAPPGGSGASGRRGTATASGGGNSGGGGGAFREFWVSRAQLVTLLAAGNITSSVGLGGAAVAGPTSNATSYTQNNPGNNGSAQAVFGGWVCFQGGGANGNGASGSSRAGGGGGGMLTAGTGGGTGTGNSSGGEPMPGTATNSAAGNLTTLFGGGSCGVPSGTIAFRGGTSVWGGGAGGAGTATGTASAVGGDSVHGAAGAGSGGRANNGTGDDGGDGGVTGGRTSRASAGTAANGTGIQTGGNGDDGADATDVWLGLGDGGAGGGAAGSSTGAATGGNGGAGGFPGGGGGGGGTGSTQAVGSASTGGTSGAGGDGLIIIEAYA
jgi:hypothetical protein